MTWELEDRDLPMRYLVHDHDTRFTGLFDTVFEAEGIEVVTIPYEASNANAFAERWARSVREECLDRLIILNERHLRRVLIVYLAYYNARRPHQGLDRDRSLGLEPVSIAVRSAIGTCSGASSATTTARLPDAHFSRRLVFEPYGIESSEAIASR